MRRPRLKSRPLAALTTCLLAALLALCLGLCRPAEAAAYSSVAAGNWSNPFTWSYGTASATQPANGSFETPAEASNTATFTPSGASWAFTGNSFLVNPPSPYGAPSAVDGAQELGLQTAAQVSQTFTWAAGTYYVSLYAAQRAGQAQTVTVSVDGTTVGGVLQPPGSAFARYVVGPVTVTAGSHTLALAGTNAHGGDNTAFIDNVQLLDPPTAVPGNGDTVTVNNAVTVDRDVTVGNSPPANSVPKAVALNAAPLTVSPGVTLRMRGDGALSGAGANLTLSAGSALIFDGSVSQASYSWSSTGGNGTPGVITAGGAPNNPVTIASDAGGPNGFFTTANQNYDDGLCRWSYVNAARLGGASTPAVTVNTGYQTAGCSFDHVIFDACGGINSPGITPGANFTVTNCTWKNSPAGASNLGLSCSSTTPTGTRTLSGCVFDRQANLPMWNLTCTGNVFLASFVPGGSNYGGGTFSGNFVRFADGDNSASMSWGTGQGGLARINNWSGDYLAVDDNTYDGAGHYTALTTAANPHWTHFGATGTLAVDRCVFEGFFTDGTGDIDYGPNGTNYNSSFTFNLILPDQNSDANGFLNSGTLTTNNGWSGEASVYEHNTFYNGGQGPLALAEAGNGYANMVSSYRDNLVWNDARRVGQGYNYMAYYSTTPAGAVTDMVTPANCDYNAGWNVNSTGTRNGNGHYNILESSTVGAHDVYGNPNFVDSTRNFPHWVKSLVGNTLPGNASPTTTDYDAWGLYLLSLTNSPLDSNYNASATISSLMAWVRAGFVPRAAALHNAAHDGTDIGAVAVNSAQLLFRRLNGMRSGSRTSY